MRDLSFGGAILGGAQQTVPQPSPSVKGRGERVTTFESRHQPQPPLSHLSLQRRPIRGSGPNRRESVISTHPGELRGPSRLCIVAYVTSSRAEEAATASRIVPRTRSPVVREAVTTRSLRPATATTSAGLRHPLSATRRPARRRDRGGRWSSGRRPTERARCRRQFQSSRRCGAPRRAWSSRLASGSA